MKENEYEKVLVAEDEESIREFIVINLTPRSGYDVMQAENGAAALDIFQKRRAAILMLPFLIL